ncbi:acetyl-CoA carboxylase, carboxyl transferase, beta subunit [Streptantibioticus cattleyicolor NRRL 8057 = DSM 46488]|uniref:Multifunctional fusion protein n=1 Tax=Streptantibioticus cattleyicolor (strain ATCC 35852 / DSM 46488 / JCM 4925 / NBRC 14057 / NRRL 8057) TaxID=1003195 RepID=G8X3M1_STREN|nr:acetyl-CoA carboxylase, carboxyl transferase, beta subunit [Streptantibioticus cattleyicolor NRRL 8057 = DSM 46488]
MTSPAPATGVEWARCHNCQAIVYGRSFARAAKTCPECGRHAQLTAAERIAQLLDDGTGEPLEPGRTLQDPLGFTDSRPYPERLAEARAHTGADSAVLAATGLIQGSPVVIAAMDFRFMGGSMGSAEGEAVTTAAEAALARRIPLVIATASGGARMQEGVYSLFQMAKTAQALAALDEAGVLTVSIVSDPTYGGVAASFATLTDVIIAEPGARMGFAGPRVIEQTIRERLPDGFQTAEFLLAHGLVDAVLPRSRHRDALATLVRAATRRDAPAGGPADHGAIVRDPALLPVRPAWDAVRTARDTARPTTLDHLGRLLDEFVELHGDRASGDCRAVVAGLGLLDGRPLAVIGHQKGHTTKELADHEFGLATPDGYRKAARVMRLAAKLGVPVLTLIDTPGAYPGVDAERNGQAVAIAENLRLMSQLPVPLVAVVLGEGGSGGALALAVADRVLVGENAVYSVISPEGCAAILWHDRAAAPEAAEALGLDARSLLGHGLVDGVVPEPEGGAQRDPDQAAERLRGAVRAAFGELAGVPAPELVAARRRRFRRTGVAPPGGSERRPGRSPDLTSPPPDPPFDPPEDKDLA